METVTPIMEKIRITAPAVTTVAERQGYAITHIELSKDTVQRIKKAMKEIEVTCQDPDVKPS